MKKFLIVSLIAFTMLGITGAAVAWKIDIDACVKDATVEVTASTAQFDEKTGFGYMLGTEAGVSGTGHIDIDGSGKKDKIETEVSTGWFGDDTSIYATQTMLVVDCLPDCADGQCCCPTYTYLAMSGATIDGKGEIELESNVIDRHNDQVQDLEVHGRGDFTAGMMTYAWDGIVDITAEKVPEPASTHVMGAYGTDVRFCANGHTEFEANDGGESGWFVANMGFYDPGCNGCPGCPGCPP